MFYDDDDDDDDNNNDNDRTHPQLMSLGTGAIKGW